MSKPSREDALAHFGVKGMRWGVRNSPTSSSASKTKQTTTKSESKVSKAVGRVKNMSTGEKRLIVGIGATGAAVVASILAGPAGGVAVSSLGRIADYKLSNPIANQLNEVNAITTRANEITKEIKADPLYKYGR